MRRLQSACRKDPLQLDSGSRTFSRKKLLFDSNQDPSFCIASSFALASSEVVEPRETGRSHFFRHSGSNMSVSNTSGDVQNGPMFSNAKSGTIRTQPKSLGRAMEDTDASSDQPCEVAGANSDQIKVGQHMAGLG
jgi:hypothetical protein